MEKSPNANHSEVVVKLEDIRAILFDLFGTLVLYRDRRSAETSWVDVLYRILLEHGLAVAHEVLRDLCKSFFNQPAPPQTDEGLTIFERRLQRLAVQLGVDLQARNIVEIARSITAAHMSEVLADEEAVPVLSALSKRTQLALVSNFDHPPLVYAILREMGLQDFFNLILLSGEVGVRKPSPLIYRRAIEKLRVSAEEALFVGDSPEDVEGANAVGMRAVLVDRSAVQSIKERGHCQRPTRLGPQAALGASSPNLVVCSSLKDILILID
jgi:HAD superfamily hydrolase (TIGR01509 family)